VFWEGSISNCIPARAAQKKIGDRLIRSRLGMAQLSLRLPSRRALPSPGYPLGRCPEFNRLARFCITSDSPTPHEFESPLGAILATADLNRPGHQSRALLHLVSRPNSLER